MKVNELLSYCSSSFESYCRVLNNEHNPYPIVVGFVYSFLNESHTHTCKLINHYIHCIQVCNFSAIKKYFNGFPHNLKIFLMGMVTTYGRGVIYSLIHNNE